MNMYIAVWYGLIALSAIAASIATMRRPEISGNVNYIAYERSARIVRTLWMLVVLFAFGGVGLLPWVAILLELMK